MRDSTQNSKLKTTPLSEAKGQDYPSAVRALADDDMPALEDLLMRAPAHNVFHLSALLERGLSPMPESYGAAWAMGVLRGGELIGALVEQRGTGCIYHAPGDADTLRALASVVTSSATGGHFSLLS